MMNESIIYAQCSQQSHCQEYLNPGSSLNNFLGEYVSRTEIILEYSNHTEFEKNNTIESRQFEF
jgi:hypothetical protein